MKLLEERILQDGTVRPGGIVKVDRFLNHQIDVSLLDEMGKEFYRLFQNDGVTKILTVEASGIAIACLAAQYFKVPVVFAKKSEAKNLDSEVYAAEVRSYTKGKVYTVRVSKSYLSKNDRVLIIDDFLANGEAVRGLRSITEQAGATLAGVGIAIEKGFQPGGDQLRKEGVHLESLAIVELTEEGGITFRAQ